MKKNLSVEIGGIVFAFCSKIPRLDCLLSKRYNPFLSSKTPHLKVSLDYKDNAPFFSGQKIFQVDNRYDIVKNNHNLIFNLYPDRKKNNNSQILILKKGSKQARFYLPRLTSYKNRNFFDYPLDQLLMMSILWRKNGILSHGCGIIRDERTFIFLGESGAGKTTISRILNRNGLCVQSDDRIIVRKIKGDFFAFGTPWAGAGQFFSSKAGRLHIIFFLYHGKKNRLVRISGRQALEQILTCAFIPYWDETATGAAIDMAISLTKKKACYRLEFLPDDSVFHFLRKHLDD